MTIRKTDVYPMAGNKLKYNIVETVLNTMLEGLVVVDQAGIITYANPSYTRILGIKPERVIGKPLKKVEPQARLLHVLESGDSILDEKVRVRTVNKTVVLNNVPILEDGSVIGAFSLFRDITDEVNLSDRLKKTELLKDTFKDQLLKSSQLRNSPPYIVGFSRKLMEAVHMAKKVAPTDSSVLIRGESGTGKELFAKAIMEENSRKNKPFVTINCSAIPESLMESELFGYERGAFTGANTEGKPGKIELAHEGTLFLDEIGDTSLPVQMKLLRALETGVFERVGGLKKLRVDTRIIAATNRNLERMIQEGSFRGDFYYRINVVMISLPPLRERIEDIGPLVDHFLEKFQKKGHKRNVKVSLEVMELFKRHDWPGNVRELEHVIEHALVMMEGSLLELRFLPSYIQNYHKDNKHEGPAHVTEPSKVLRQKVLDLEKDMIIEALEQNRYNKTRAIDMLGMSRRTFYKKLKDFGIKA